MEIIKDIAFNFVFFFSCLLMYYIFKNCVKEFDNLYRRVPRIAREAFIIVCLLVQSIIIGILPRLFVDWYMRDIYTLSSTFALIAMFALLVVRLEKRKKVVEDLDEHRKAA